MKKRLLLLVMMLHLLNPAWAFNLTDNGNGTVIDQDTGLIWQQGEGGDHNWQAAKGYCQGLQLAGGGWRLPEVRELESLILDDRHSPATDPSFFPQVKSDGYYWSATPGADNSSRAWDVDFGDGDVGRGGRGDGRHVRCVRASGAR